MKRLEDFNFYKIYSNDKRFLGPDHLKDFAIKIGKKQFEEEIFIGTLPYTGLDPKFLDLTEYTELDLNSQLKSMINLRNGFFKQIENEIYLKIEELKKEHYFFFKIFSCVESKHIQQLLKYKLRKSIEHKNGDHIKFFDGAIDRINEKIIKKMEVMLANEEESSV
jgi:hypothetical protein